jgi:hypothetical protein
VYLDGDEDVFVTHTPSESYYFLLLDISPLAHIHIHTYTHNHRQLLQDGKARTKEGKKRRAAAKRERGKYR